MPQGNPFGNKGGDWMPDAALRALFDAGTTYDLIADANHALTGWRPTKSAVLRKRRSLDLPKRHAGHDDLLPWRIQRQHQDSVIRHMLQAEGRRRLGLQLSDVDERLVRLLNEQLTGGPGRDLVVDYHPDTGFAYVRREDADTDIIRAPRPNARLRRSIGDLDASSVTPAWVDQSADPIGPDRSDDPDYSEREPDDMLDWSCRDCGWPWPYIAPPSVDTECEMCGGELTNRGSAR